MINWNKLSEWSNKAGTISTKMKDFAKDLVTVDDNLDLDDPLTQEFFRSQGGANINQDNFQQKEIDSNSHDGEQLDKAIPHVDSTIISTELSYNDDQNLKLQDENTQETINMEENDYQRQNQQIQQVESLQINETLQKECGKQTKQHDTQNLEEDGPLLFTKRIELIEKFEYKQDPSFTSKLDQLFQEDADLKSDQDGPLVSQENTIDKIRPINMYLKERVQQLLGNEFVQINQQVNDLLQSLQKQQENQQDLFQNEYQRQKDYITKQDTQIKYIEAKLMENAQKMTSLFEDNVQLQGKMENVKPADQQSFHQLLQDLQPVLQQYIKKLFALFKTSWQQPEFETNWKESALQGPKEVVTNIFNQLQKCEQLVHREKMQHIKINENYQKIQDLYTKLQDSDQYISKREQILQGENLVLQKRLVEALDKITGAGMQLKDKDVRIKDLEKLSAEWDKNKREFVDEIKLRSTEIDSLKQKLKTNKQDILTATQQVQQSQQDLVSQQELQYQIEQRDEEIERLSQLLEEWQQENQQLQNGIQNIQIINEQEETKRNILQTKYEGELCRTRAELEQYGSIGKQFQELSQNYENLKKFSSDQSKQFVSLEYKLVRAEQRIIELETEVAALQKKVKSDQSYQSHLVDRRVVGKFIVNYFDPSTQYPVKLQIMETLASIMQFTEEDKEKVGFYRLGQHQLNIQKTDSQNSLTSSPPVAQTPNKKNSLKDKLIGFLMENNEE